MSLQSLTTASWSPLGTSLAASQTIWTWAEREPGCGAPSQASLMYRDSRKAAEAEERGQQGHQGKPTRPASSHPPLGGHELLSTPRTACTPTATEVSKQMRD